MRIAAFILNRLMPLWLIVLAIAAYLSPSPFLWLSPYSSYLLGFVILMMSLTLTSQALAAVFLHPKAAIVAFVTKWITVPLVAVIAAHVVYSSQPQLAAGTILDGSVPAAVSSNLFTFLSSGSVALAVSLCGINTILAPVLTPSFTTVLAGTFVPVSFMAMFIQLLEIILLPLVLGMAIRYALGQERIHKAEPVLPMLSALALYGVEVGIVSNAAGTIQKNIQWVPIVFITTSVLVVINLTVAYLVARVWMHFDEATSRAIMFDIGIYNSGLGAVLATTNISAFAALPPMANMIMNMIIGALLASYLQSYRPLKVAPPVVGGGGAMESGALPT